MENTKIYRKTKLREELKYIKSDKKELRKFGLTVGIVLLVLGGIFFWLGKDLAGAFTAAPAGFVLGSLCLGLAAVLRRQPELPPR